MAASRVGHAVFVESDADDVPPQGRCTVDCSTWARRDLRAVVMESGKVDGAADGSSNEDYHWHREWNSIVPTGAQLALRYADDTTVLLPCDPVEARAVRLDAFLPSLLTDLR